MNIKKIREFLGWCTIINAGFLAFTVIAFLAFHDMIYEIHNLFFSVSVETYDAILFLTIAFLKSLVIVFNFVPYLVLRIMYNDEGIKK